MRHLERNHKIERHTCADPVIMTINEFSTDRGTNFPLNNNGIHWVKYDNYPRRIH